MIDYGKEAIQSPWFPAKFTENTQIDIENKHFAFADISGFAAGTKLLDFLKELVTQYGGIWHNTVVKKLDYMVVCPIYHSFAYKKEVDKYEAAEKLIEKGHPVAIISDVDLCIKLDCFSKLGVVSKARIAKEYVLNESKFHEKAALKIKTFIKQNQTSRYKDYLNSELEIAKKIQVGNEIRQY